MRPIRILPLLLLATLLPSPPSPAAAAQSLNIPHPVEVILDRLMAPELEILNMSQARPLISGDRSAQVLLAGGEGEVPLPAHWKPVRAPGEGFNNEPRYEIAAWRIQQLFLDEEEYVVPPKVLRAVPLTDYEGVREERSPTIRGTNSFVFILSYWVQDVTNTDPFDPIRLERDEAYARAWGNVNLLTHLIDHKDSNVGNLLISVDPDRPRFFAVDNDVAWRSQSSSVGDRWRRLLTNRLPADVVERLRNISTEDLEGTLGVVAEFAIVDGYLEPVAPGPNLGPNRGVRITEDRVQFGLTAREIRDTEGRIRNVLRDVDRGRIRTF
jgi:hypothetical protein